MPNRLNQATSPYLLQHADNPVDWYPWGPEALETARQQDKPIFLSIGYAACHWCHVMAHESFEDTETAALMNAHFISIKVDREERPDIDSIYMDAVVALTGGGGWPLSVFLTPDGEPFFGGTYFPPEPRHRLPSFRQLLSEIAGRWREDRLELIASGQRLAEHIGRSQGLQASADGLPSGLAEHAGQRLHQTYDWTAGGWGGAPKFPQASAIDYLLAQHSASGDKLARDMAIHALRAMASGGIYDQLGGGFARYAVDRAWQVPHFEKMLYDNALLLQSYLHAWQVTGEPLFRQVADETYAFLNRELRAEAGGYYASLDADSEGEEGKFYVWTIAEVTSVLNDKVLVELAQAAFGITAQGNFEGATVLRRAADPQALASRLDLTGEQASQALQRVRQSLFSARSGRPRPGLDDKVVTAWNGLLLHALCQGAQATGEISWRDHAEALAHFVEHNLYVDGRLMRVWREGTAAVDAFLEDHAALGLGYLALYQTTFDKRWYQAAVDRADEILRRYKDPDWGFFDTADDHESLVARPKSLQDSPTPSGNAMAVRLLLRVHALTGERRYLTPAETALAHLASPMAEHPTAFAAWLLEAKYLASQQPQLALVGDPASDAFKQLAQVPHQRFTPFLVSAGGPEGTSEPALMVDRHQTDGLPTAYLCHAFACQLPVTDPPALATQLGEAA